MQICPISFRIFTFALLLNYSLKANMNVKLQSTFSWDFKKYVVRLSFRLLLVATLSVAPTWPIGPWGTQGCWDQVWVEDPWRRQQHGPTHCASSEYHQCPIQLQWAPRTPHALQREKQHFKLKSLDISLHTVSEVPWWRTSKVPLPLRMKIRTDI